MNERVDSNSSMWLLRSLVAMGHSGARISRALGVNDALVHAIVNGHRPTVSKTLRDDILVVWEAWWDKVPLERNRGEKCAARQARNAAKKNRWPTPANLDEEDLEEPGYRPYAHWRPATGVGVADDFPLGDRTVAS